MEIIPVRTASLGDSTYLLIDGDQAIVIDPQRDLGRFLAIIEERGAHVTHVLETHMHNDYISGGRDLARRTGADLVMPAASGAIFAFVPAFNREVIETPGGLTITPLHTPGHTLAHTSYVIGRDEDAGAAFTGGSLLVGAAGRSDLLGDPLARQLAVLQFGSLQRLAALPNDTGVYPTHGEGSFCTASGAGRSTSTIGIEKAENPLYRFESAEAFADDQLAGLVPYPAYYQFMGPINRSEPTAIAIGEVPELSPDEIEAHLAAGGSVLDGRDRSSFAGGHVPGSIGIEIGTSFAPWAGWLLPYDAPVALVLDHGQDADDAATELSRIGLEGVVGVLRGVDGWIESGRDVAEYDTASSADLGTALSRDEAVQVLDVRDPLEWAAGHIEGSLHTYVPDLLDGVPHGVSADQPVWVICRSGNRASIAAGLLERHGLDLVVVTKGGVPDLL